MKFQPRRFIVEVKRGTSRAAFTSVDSVSEKFSSAEELLFGRPAKGDAAERGPRPASPKAAVAGTEAWKPPGRVLESLIEPAPPRVEDLPERPRRGRKPGSKNKPKLSPAPAAIASAAPEPGLVPRSPAPVAAMSARSPAEDASAWRDTSIVSAPPPAAESPFDAAPSRGRLRDRSTILKRYVLDTEPKPGQPGYLRARRAARAR